MREEALLLLQQTAVKADGNRWFNVPGEPPFVYYVEQNGSLAKRYATLPPLRREVADVPSLVRFLMDYVDQTDEKPTGLRQIWIDQTQLVSLAGGRDSAILRIPVSAPFAMLTEWNQKPATGVMLTQAELWRLLRTTFRGFLPNHSGLATQVGKVDIQKVQESKGVTSREKVSMHKSLIAEASGAKDLPEVLTFNVPLFDRKPLSCTVNIDVAFELDATSEKFNMTVLPGEIDKANADGRAYLQSQVYAAFSTETKEGEETSIEVYHGRP